MRPGDNRPRPPEPCPPAYVAPHQAGGCSLPFWTSCYFQAGKFMSVLQDLLQTAQESKVLAHEDLSSDPSRGRWKQMTTRAPWPITVTELVSSGSVRYFIRQNKAESDKDPMDLCPSNVHIHTCFNTYGSVSNIHLPYT